jgi:hypothetical protein
MRPNHLLPTVLLAAACSGAAATAAPEPATSAASVQIGDSVRVVRGQPLSIDGGRLTIAFTDLNDSRCPANVVCVWEGDAAATLRLEGAGAVATPTLHTRLDPKGTTHAGYEITLVNVTPYPGTEPPNARLAPTAILRVTRR